MRRALVTGAEGFIGHHLVSHLLAAGWQVDGSTRQQPDRPAYRVVPAASLAGHDLSNYDVVFHLAGMAHGNVRGQSEQQLRSANVDQTVALYRQAVAANVPRFIWVSSIKVMGDISITPFSVDDAPDPQDAYGRSKARAEQALQAQPAGTTRLSMVRPALVYGPGVKENFFMLLKLANSGLPLPLGSAKAPRAMVSVDNLVDLLDTLANTEVERLPGVLHVRDAEESSVRHLFRRLAGSLGARSRLFPFNPGLAMSMARVIGKGPLAQRLFCPLQVDMQSTIDALDWRPPYDQNSELDKVARWYLTR